MINIDNYFEKFFNDKVYKLEWSENCDKQIILDDFKTYVNTLPLTDKIRIACYDNFNSCKDLFFIDENTSEGYFKKTLTNLNKNLNLKIKKYDGLNNYKTTKKGLRILFTNISSFTRENNYIKELSKYELKENFNEQEIAKAFNNFLNEYKIKEIKYILNNDYKSLEISYNELSEFDFFLTENLLANPLECISLFEETLVTFSELEKNKIKIRIIDLPNSENIKIGDHRKKNINKLVSFEGLIRRKSDVKPRLKSVEYLCTNPQCTFSSNKIIIPQYEEKVKKLKSCPKCKGGIEEINKVLDDSMLLILEQDFTERNSDFDSKKIHVKIDNNLTNEKNYYKLKISSKIKVVGILREISKTTQGGSESINYDYILEANNIIFLNDDEDIVLSKEDIQEIKDFGKDKNCFEEMTNNYIPKIFGNSLIKQALLLQHIGSSFDGQRNDSHILLLGDPSTAKTEMINESLSYAIRHVYSSGTSSTKAGMTATAIKDDLTGTWVLEPGVLPRANGGIAGLDEMDKLNRDDADCLTEALEQQCITVNKANISARLQTQCAFLTGANPKFGKFDNSMDITKQINFNAALLSRFDLIFILKDNYDYEKDNKLINHILEGYSNDLQLDNKYSKDFIKKYIYYCKTNFKPRIDEKVKKAINKYYIEVRKNTNHEINFSFTPRQIKGVIRFAAAYAKFHQKNIITLKHIQYAFKLFNTILSDLGVSNMKAIKEADYLKNTTEEKKND